MFPLDWRATEIDPEPVANGRFAAIGMRDPTIAPTECETHAWVDSR